MENMENEVMNVEGKGKIGLIALGATLLVGAVAAVLVVRARKAKANAIEASANTTNTDSTVGTN